MLIKDIVQEWLEWRASGGRGVGFVLSTGEREQVYRVVDDLGTQIVLEAPCAVCRQPFQTDLTVGQKLQPKRTCKACRGQFVQPRRERAARPRRQRAARPAYVKPPRTPGVVEEVVLEVLDALEPVAKPSIELVARLTAARLPRGSGRQDQRYKVAKRALRTLVARGVVPSLAL